jgi:hypothetical protein
MLLNHAPIYAGAFVAFDDRISDDLRWDLTKSRKTHPILILIALREHLSDTMKYQLINLNNPIVNTVIQTRSDLTETQELTAWL